jgi:FAD:protein FMN transferase
VEDLLSLTVIGPDILQADVLATAAFAKGHGALELVERFQGYEAYAIRRDSTASWTTGFDVFTERAS